VTSALPEAITSLSSYDESINALIVAESGWGKTVLAGTADQRKTDGGKALFLATETGTLSASRMGSTADLWPIRTWDSLPEVYRFFRYEGGCDMYEWALFDSITEMQKLSMDSALRRAVRDNQARDPDIPAIQDYMKVQQQTLNFLRRFNELPVNCLYTALPLRLEDESGQPYFLPALDGKQGGIAQQAMGYMHVVGHGTKRVIDVADGKRKMVRRVFFQSTGPYRAKDRYGALGRFMDDITIPQITELINKGKPEGATRHALPPSAAGVLSPEQPGLGSEDPSTTEVVDAEIVGDPNEY
jgi:AAA domain